MVADRILSGTCSFYVYVFIGIDKKCKWPESFSSLGEAVSIGGHEHLAAAENWGSQAALGR